jgi:hypothetical protein
MLVTSPKPKDLARVITLATFSTRLIIRANYSSMEDAKETITTF